MNNFTFYSPTKFVFGKDTENQAGALIKEFGLPEGGREPDCIAISGYAYVVDGIHCCLSFRF